MLDHIPIELVLKEMSRKLVHILSIIAPILYHFVDKAMMLSSLILILIISLYFEYSRMNSKLFYNHLNRLLLNNIGIHLDNIIRPHEKKNLTGASYMIIAMIIVCIFSHKVIFITSFAILAISDTLAALIGLRFGRHKVFNKSIEGSVAFFISAFIISHFIFQSYNIEIPIKALILLAGITTISELLAKKIKIDDNLLIPITFAITYDLLIN